MTYFVGHPIKGSRCPKCNHEVVYNGNYFCVNYERKECDWALSHPTRSYKDKHAFNVAYVLLMKARGEEPKLDVLERWKGEIA